MENLKHVHHKDFNSLNNSPNNLEIMSYRDHIGLHSRIKQLGPDNHTWDKFMLNKKT